MTYRIRHVLMGVCFMGSGLAGVHLIETYGWPAFFAAMAMGALHNAWWTMVKERPTP